MSLDVMSLTKICTKCNKNKSSSDFSKDSRRKSGLSSHCKSCKKEYNDLTFLHRSKRDKEKYYKNRIVKQKDSIFGLDEDEKKCSGCALIKKLSEFYKDASCTKGVKHKCIECIKLDSKLKKKPINSKKRLEAKKRYVYENKDKVRLYQREYYKRRYKEDAIFALKNRIESLIGFSLRNNGFKKSSSTCDILGCTFDEFKLHIECQFKDGMSWGNRADWHIDHKIPISSGKTEKDIIALNHYTNLQPLYAKDNLKKGKKIM